VFPARARTAHRRVSALAACALGAALVALPAAPSAAGPASASAPRTLRIVDGRYLVVLSGTQAEDGTMRLTGTPAAVQALVASAGGAVVSDLSRQIGVLVVQSANPVFARLLGASPLVSVVGNDFGVKVLGDAPEPADDPFESVQWDMAQIRTDEAHATQGGIPAVDVGVLDTGIDGQHVEFLKGGVSNVDCARGRDSLQTLPPGVAVGNPFPCVDNQFHGTHVAGTIGARANGYGIVGVAPNVTLVPVKVCDTTGYCYVSPSVDGITYAGDIKLDVINMSFFVDDNEFQESTEFKCLSDPVQRAFRQSVERALAYARGRGVVPVAALGNSDQDLQNPVDDDGNPIPDECAVVPAESPGVIGTAALGANSEKASYSNWGAASNTDAGGVDVSAPGGNGTTGDCSTTVLSTIPGNLYGCFQGTSMASPHAAGVAALIVSQYGVAQPDGDIHLSPALVERQIKATAIDIGQPGYDECFGHGRVDALRAVTNDTSPMYDASAPFCPEYAE
jgi:subtilisin family serine protease